MSKVEKGVKNVVDEDEPGPGHYKYYKQAEKGGVTIGKRFRERVEYTPGPGDYVGMQDWADGYGYSVNAQKYYEAADMYEKRRADFKELKEERKKEFLDKMDKEGGEGKKLVTKSYAYEIDPTKVTSERRTPGKDARAGFSGGY